jgi:bifunctional non-homologous end joining protein LigD
MPIRWKDLSSILPTDFNLLSVPKTIKTSGNPWKDVLQENQDINKILEGVKQIE